MDNKHLMFGLVQFFCVGIICYTVLVVFDVANANQLIGVGGPVMLGAGFLITNFKLQGGQKVLERKLDTNTALTLETKKDAAQAVGEAVQTAVITTSALKDVAVAVNGRLTEQKEDARKAGYTEGVMAGQALFERHDTAITDLTKEVSTISTRVDVIVERQDRHVEANKQNNKMLSDKLDALMKERQ